MVLLALCSFAWYSSWFSPSATCCSSGTTASPPNILVLPFNNSFRERQHLQHRRTHSPESLTLHMIPFSPYHATRVEHSSIYAITLPSRCTQQPQALIHPHRPSSLVVFVVSTRRARCARGTLSVLRALLALAPWHCLVCWVVVVVGCK